MPDLLPEGASIPGHKLVDGGRPLAVQGAGDVPAQGEAGYARCECGRSSGLRSSDERRRQWHADHLRDEQARVRLGANRSTVHEVLGRCREEGERERGQGGRGVKGGSQVLAHGSSRGAGNGRGIRPSPPLCGAAGGFNPLPDLLKCAQKGALRGRVRVALADSRALCLQSRAKALNAWRNMPASQQDVPQEAAPNLAGDTMPKRLGGTGERGNSFANGPNRGALHMWPCYCRWCLDGSVPEMRG